MALIGARGAAPRQAPLKAGEPAPDFTVVDQHGTPFRLSEALAARHFVVLAFYVKAFTGGWEREFSRFRDDETKYSALNAEIVGVSADPPERNLAWSRHLRLPFRLLSDPSGELGRRFGVWDDTWNLERRVTFVIDRARRVRYVESGNPAIDTSGALEAVSRLAKSK